ncbi:SPX domain-containing protein [Cordyceps javanica]|uniref:SPX domain-containing protein n=1 Tax=Cordyceps javanica TaxID=43265 RepID=A0A545VIM2_9HYPO|nr:SPX domain-containing protein [Cordyceps javanica]TQW01583.1 SPX domain protein [Cordyceps javanica]
MRFGKTLRESINGPWKDKYIDYNKLKTLLREDKFDDDNEDWTEDDENRFCEEIFNVQLEKVAKFQEEQVSLLRDHADAAFAKLKKLAPPAPADGSAPESADDATKASFKELEAELDGIMNQVKELKKYSSINYTGFLKIVKKHDRKRGNRYKVRPMMQHSLAQRPFNSEQGYSALLNKLSIMYYAIRQQLEDDPTIPIDLETQGETLNGERYTAHKFWIHPDNLLEVRTLILRHLPALIYSQQTSKEFDGSESPTVTSLYFDNKSFELYNKKVDSSKGAESLRLRWYGQLSTKPDILVEQKVAEGTGESRESKFSIKDKYVTPFIAGEYSMEKTAAKMERQGQSADAVAEYKKTVDSIQSFQQKQKLAPVMRANYLRTAFQKPADDRIRISIDTDLAFIREDTLDTERPCRNPDDWHRTDIDDSNMTYPFRNINQSEVSKFPYAVLEIKLREDSNRKRPVWVEDLLASHLIHAVPRFSKFVHGVASLFEDHVNALPFWLSDLETDIRKDPQLAFEAEEQRRAQRADDALAVGSLIGTVPSSSYKAAKSSSVGKSYLADRMAAESRDRQAKSLNHRSSIPAQPEEEGEGSGSSAHQNGHSNGGYGTLSSVLPALSLSKYAKAKRAQRFKLPEGVVEPTEWIKNAGELKVEPKVWLANERTFLKWQHICILQGTLALALYTAAGENTTAAVFGVVYTGIAVFAGVWGYAMLRVRRNMIIERSGKDFDNMVGPIIISVALIVALIANFIIQYRKAFDNMSHYHPDAVVPIRSAIQDELR